MALRRILRTFWLTTLVVAGCDCDSISRLTIVDPEDGATLGVDADDTMSGFQYDVVVRVDVLDPGETLRVYTDASVLDSDPNAPTPYTVIVGDDDSATLRVTLTPGANPLVACARDACGMRSPTVRVTVEAGECPNIAFTSPAVGTEPSIHLGPSDDQDGSACGAEFAAAVRVNADVPNGTTLNLLVNEVAAASAEAADGVVDFGNVVLGNRGDTPNSLTVQVADSSGCSAVIGKPVFVDCDGASCAITAPSPASMFLNAANDSDPVAAGLQLDVTVTSDADTADETTRLIIDADDANALTTTAVAAGTVATSNFDDVALTEGAHAVQAECEDVAGNVTRSSVAMWTVDTVACGIALTSPTAGQDIGVNDDLDLGTAGIQINAVGTATGMDCNDVRAAPCSAIAGVTFGTLTANAFSESVTLGSAPSQEVCAEVRDVAGNIASAQAQVDVTTDAPALAVLTPVANTAFNRLGNPVGPMTFVADLANGTPACDVAFTVDCEGVGEPVDIVRGMTVLGTATCVANGMSAFGGIATFTSVALPTDATAFTVFAQQTVGGSTGVSSAISITGDCAAPTLTISAPACGSVFDGSDDTNAMAAGFQVPVTVTSSDSAPMPVRLLIVSNAGGQLSDDQTLGTPSGNDYVFPTATFGFAALFDVVATTIDAFGNGAQSSACQMTANDLPTLAVSVPTANFVVNAANAAASDCDGGTPGLQLQVTASTNATAGSAASIQIGTATELVTTVMAGAISGCVDAPEGAVNVVVEVDDTTTGDGVSGNAQVTVPIVVDTTAPTGTFSPSVTILNHRIATVQLDFTALSDGTEAFAAYALRCAGSPIADEAAWNAATPIAMPTPSGGGTMESIQLGSMANRVFRTGVRYQCALRGQDIGGNLTPLPVASTQIFPAFEVTQVSSLASQTRTGFSGAVPAGDVNDDGFPDVLVSGFGSAQLYFGGAISGPTDTADISFFTAGQVRLGGNVAGIGDFDDDGIDDIAISNVGEATNAGAVYIYRGRSAAAWALLGPTVTVDTATCTADLCIRGGAAQDFLGFGVSAIGNFDLDGDDDIAISVCGLNQVLVLSGRPLNGATVTIASNPDGFVIQGPAGLNGPRDFGCSVTGLGNVIGSAATDLLIGRSGFNNGTNTFTTAAQLFMATGRARVGAGLETINITGADQVAADLALAPGSTISGSRSTLGSLDFDGDGDRDIVVRDSVSVDVGFRVLYNSGTGTFSAAGASTVISATAPAQDYLGFLGVSSYHPTHVVGDIDGDGREDILSSALGAGPSTAGSGALVYGRASPGALIDWTTSTSAAVLTPLPLPTDPLPISAFRYPGYIGDIDDDGFDDIVVADPAADSATPNGRFFILH